MENLTIENCLLFGSLICFFAIFILRLTAFCVKLIKEIEQNEINLKKKNDEN